MDKKPLPTLPEEPPEKTMSPKKVFAPSERNRQPSANSVTNGVKVVFSTPKPIKKESYVRTNSSYSSSNQLELGYDSNEPCSSAQAEARCRQNSDTGYSSVSPRPTIFSKFPPVATAQNDSEEETKKEEARIAELKKKGSPKTLVDMFKMEAKLIPMKKGEDTKSEKDSKQKKVKVVRPENMPVTAPNFFAGQEYGYYLTEMVNRGTETLLMIYERDPEKFFKRFDRKWYQRVMPLLFGKSHKTPAEIVKNLREVLIILDKLPPPKLDKDGNVVSDKKYDKSVEEVAKNVALIKNLIYGNEGSNSETDHVVQVAQLAQEIYNANILPMVVKMLPKFEFECKKDVGQIFNNLLRRQIGTRSPTVEYLGARPEILVQLVQGYTNSDIALTCGLMLRESIRHDHLAKMILYSDVFYTFFHYVQSEVFDIASDAFATFKELTTRHKTLCAEFLETHYDTFFAQYQNLLNSKNYVTRRQSLKLLGELLLDRHNFNIMHKYISNPENMRVLMELLRDKSRNIQYEAFHVFKVFVANPNKSKPICDILLRNREKLVEFLGEFHNDRTDDEQFNDEKAYLIKQIQEMKGSPKEAKKHKTKEDELITSVEAVTLADPTPSTSSQQ